MKKLLSVQTPSLLLERGLISRSLLRLSNPVQGLKNPSSNKYLEACSDWDFLFFCFIAIILITLVPVVSAVATTSTDFQKIENPTYTDLLFVANPTVADFNKLGQEDQRMYLFMHYDATFAQKYLATSTYADPRDKIIAQQFYSESATHINSNPAGFTAYLKSEGVDVRGISGPVKSYSMSGDLKGTNQQVNINAFKKSPMKDKYALQVTSSGDIELIPKTATGQSGTPVQFTGTIQTVDSGKFNMQSGTINGVPVKYAYALQFNSEGDIVGGNVNEFNGITFAKPTPIKASFGDYGVSMVVHDAQVVSVKEDIIDTYMSGSASFPQSGDGIESPVYVSSGNEFIINGYKVKSSTNQPAVEIRLGDPSWYDSYLEDAEASMGAFFGLDTREDYVQVGENAVVVSGDDLQVEFNGNQFASGEPQTAPAQTSGVTAVSVQAAGLLKKGSKGDEVAAVQKMLIEQIDPDTGQPYLAATYTTKSGAVVSSADGDFGAGTDAALRAWQTDNGLVHDGKFGKASTDKAIEVSSVFSPPQYNSLISSGAGGRTVLTRENGGIVVNGQSMTASLGSDDIEMKDGEAYSKVDNDPLNPLDLPADYLPRKDDGTPGEEVGTNDNLLACVSCTYGGQYLVGAGEYATRRVVGEVGAVGLEATEGALTTAGVKKESPMSVDFFGHYVAGSGDELVLHDDEIPAEWQSWVVDYADKNRGSTASNKLGEACTGTCFSDVSPYDQGIYDLQNSFGHFDLQVAENPDGSKTYTMTDLYEFAAAPADTTGKSRHGFGLGSMSNAEVATVNAALPDVEFEHPGGHYTERLEVQNIGGKSYLMLPQQALASVGRTYPIHATFTVPAADGVVDNGKASTKTVN